MFSECFKTIHIPARVSANFLLRQRDKTNFVGVVDKIQADVISVEDDPFRKEFRKLNNPSYIWRFNAPHAFHVGGVWERAIVIARPILDGCS